MHKQIKKIGGILFLISSCFLFAGCSEENPEHQEEVVVSTEDKNKEAVQAVLESEFTVPNEEYVLTSKNIDKKMDEIHNGSPEATGTEWLAYEELVKKTYGPYFMDYAYDKLISHNVAFNYHYGYMGKNKSTPKNYNFTAQVEYKSNSGEITTHEIKGMAILSEVGKIGKFQINDDSGLGEKVSVDLQ